MEKGKKSVLNAQIVSQIEEIDRVYKKLHERKNAKTQFEVEGLSLWLHHLYCSFEDLFKIIAHAFENNIDDMSQYHVQLLRRMKMEIKGIRPNLLTEESFKLMDNLRGFRHVLRHAYVYDLEKDRVLLVAKDAIKLEKIYKKELKTFLDKI